jgi:gamma-glutamyltranspeptidase/glutathione hydrolase
MLLRFAPLPAILLLLAGVVAQPKPAVREPVTAKGGMVVCASPPAAEVGAAILKDGGNAVDAAVAVAFAMAVTWPEAGNIGGGGFMMIGPPGKEPTCIEYREEAPGAATENMFAKGDVSAYSHLVSGVPGTVRGLEKAHKQYGKLPWKRVVEPAVKLAADGFTVNAVLARGLNSVLASKNTTNAEFRKVYGMRDGTWKDGDTLKLPDLARTLLAISEKGADAFYTGEPAKQLVAEMKRGGGLITMDDMAQYRAVERKPIHVTYRGFDVYGPPPPSSGGIALAVMLNILENFELNKHDRWSPEVNHLIIEAMKRAYADRARHLGDPAFTDIPAHLTTKEYAKKLAAGIDQKKATPSSELAPEIPLKPESDSTTHFSIIDKDGLAVSNTYTLENSYGSRVVVPGAGYILNNEMTDFNPVPGETTKTGRIGTKPNLVAPRKRMLSSQTPVLVYKDGKPVLITGSPGGRTIINTVACIVVNVVDFGMSPTEAVDAPRLHHQWFPDVVRFEGVKERPDLVARLKSLGHVVTQQRQGDAHTIGIDAKRGLFLGAADKRIDGMASGVLGKTLAPPAAIPGKIQLLAARREQVERLLKADPLFATDRSIYERSGAVVRRLADAEAEAGDPAAGVKWAERWREAIFEVLIREERRRANGTGPSPIHEIHVEFITAEFDLDRRRVAMKGKPLLSQADKLKLHTDRVAALSKIEQLASRNFREGNYTEPEYLVQKLALLEAESELARFKDAMRK